MADLLIDSNVRYSASVDPAKGKEVKSFGHRRCFIRDDTSRKNREARAHVLHEETSR